MLHWTMRSSIVDLLLLAIAILGVQDAVAPFPGYSKTSRTFSSNDDPKHSGQFQQNLTGVLQRNVTGKVVHPVPPFGDSNTTSGIFKEKFNKEMTFLFSFLDQQKQCHILNKVARKVSCNISITTKIASNFTVLWKGTHCPSKPVNKPCSVDNKLKLEVRKTYLERLAKLFISLPLPFKCLIINSIASVSNYDTSPQQHSNNLRITLHQAEQETEKLFGSVKLDSKCSTVTVKRKNPEWQAAFVNITVQLRNTTQVQWIRYFEKESTQIFFEYMTKKQHSSNSDKSIHAIFFSKRKGASNSFKKGSIRTDVRKVTKIKNGTFSLRFGIKVRSTSGEYKNWGNGKDIARSLRSLKTRNGRLKASILKIRKLKKKPPSKTEILSERGEPFLTKEITLASTLFPMYLKNYYTRIKFRHKCYVLWMIGETLKRKINTIEQLYYNLKRLSKKNFCSRAARPGPTGKYNVTALIADTIDPRITTGQPTPDLIPPRADKATPEDGDGQVSASTEKEINALEIALFTLLAFMCVAILAFTINCIIFAMKSRSYANNGANATTALNNTVLARAVFSRVSTSVPNNNGHFDTLNHRTQSQNVSNPVWACCLKHPQDSSPATSNRSTPQQLLNVPRQEIRGEIPLQSDSCEDATISCSRTRTLQPVKGDCEELQTANRSQLRCTAV